MSNRGQGNNNQQANQQNNGMFQQQENILELSNDGISDEEQDNDKYEQLSRQKGIEDFDIFKK